jgi:hypothetical protein
MLNDPEIGNALIAKDRFQSLAVARGIPVPQELAWEGTGPGTLAATRGPVLIKPCVKVDWYGSQLRERLFPGDSKARVFASGAELLHDPVVALFREQLTFQEYVPGGEECLWSTTASPTARATCSRRSSAARSARTRRWTAKARSSSSPATRRSTTSAATSPRACR